MHFTEVIDLYHENLLNEPYHKIFKIAVLQKSGEKFVCP